MSMSDRERGDSFFVQFRDNVQAIRITRGAAAPTWDDVVVGLAETGSTHSVLSEQQISSQGLSRDVLFSLHFGRPKPVIGRYADWITEVLDQKVRTRVMRDFQRYAKQLDFWKDPNSKQLVQDLLQQTRDRLKDHAEENDDPDNKTITRLARDLVIKNTREFLEQLQDGNRHIDMREDSVEYDRYNTAHNAVSGFQDYIKSKDRLVRVETDPLVYIRKSIPEEGMTPFSLVETVKGSVDPFLQYTLYRNGMLTPEDYKPPCKMPNQTIIDQGLTALQFAERTRDKIVTPLHLLPGLLQNREVMLAINDLDQAGVLSEKDEPDPLMMMFGGKPGRNFIKFHAAVREAIAPDTGDEKFRHVPRVNPQLQRFLRRVESVVGAGPEAYASARMFAELIKNKQVRADLIKAGLTKDQIVQLPKTLLERSDKQKEEEQKAGKKKPENEQKVDDRTLEMLLDEYSSDRTKLAMDGKLDPLIGREAELNQMMRILLQRGRSNPFLLGEPGVGKTALFDGLAQFIASGKAPKALIGARVIILDLSSMNSGAMYRGQFEGRLLPIIQGVAERNAKNDKPPIILCIDEAHTALQAGTAEGTPGAGDLLKPYLTKGELSIIGATTQADYAKYIEPDHALVRRFQPVFVDQPKDPEAIEILKGLKRQFTSHHDIEVSDELLGLMVRLTNRYLPNLQQPDKAISILDAACARAKMAGSTELDRATLVQTIAAEAKIDPEFLEEDDSERFLRLPDDLPILVLGQDYATRKVAEALIVAKADLQDPRKPLGSFLFLGPTGVGKTETGRALARLLHGTEEVLIRIDMSDFQEKHEVSKLVGAPPGYVGYGEEGRLTGAVRRKPYSIVMLDEIEKAHPEVLKRFLPVLEEGEILDGRNQRVSFRNTVMLMSSNLGVREATAKARAEGLDPHFDPVAWRQATQSVYEQILKSYLPPELINRLDGWFIYNSLPRPIIEQLVMREVSVLSSRIKDKYGLTLAITDDLRAELADVGYNPEYGARELKRAVKEHLVTPLSGWLLRLGGSNPRRGTIRVGLNASGIHPEVVEALN